LAIDAVLYRIIYNEDDNGIVRPSPNPRSIISVKAMNNTGGALNSAYDKALIHYAIEGNK
jgi:hypothetical protein